MLKVIRFEEIKPGSENDVAQVPSLISLFCFVVYRYTFKKHCIAKGIWVSRSK